MQADQIILSPETPDDWWEVEALYDVCFAPGRTALSSYRLREASDPLSDLCWIARDQTGALAGAVRNWPVRIGTHDAVLLGPIAVHPTRQGEGIAALLMAHAIDAARTAGWARMLLVGDLPFYARFGFMRMPQIAMPPPTNPNRVLGLALRPDAWTGVAGAVQPAWVDL
jgi:predicted N-acetyltransferase YhbS